MNHFINIKYLWFCLKDTDDFYQSNPTCCSAVLSLSLWFLRIEKQAYQHVTLDAWGERSGSTSTWHHESFPPHLPQLVHQSTKDNNRLSMSSSFLSTKENSCFHFHHYKATFMPKKPCIRLQRDFYIDDVLHIFGIDTKINQLIVFIKKN